jgi:flagellar biosynthetic protein FliR
VSGLGPETVLAAFVLFCRIGGCLMLMSGFASPRVSPNIRALVAIAVTLALSPVLLDEVRPALPDDSLATVLPVIVSELLIGMMIGLLGRIFMLALQTMATAAAMSIGFSNILGAPIEDVEPSGAMVSLITMTATVLIFVTGLHWEIIRALVGSYEAMPVTEGFRAQFGLMQVTDTLSQAFYLVLRLASPFIIYSVVVNLAIGLANKLTPQIPVYVISLPFVIAGGLFLLYFAIGDFLRLFIDGFASWLAGA